MFDTFQELDSSIVSQSEYKYEYFLFLLSLCYGIDTVFLRSFQFIHLS